MTRGPVVSVSFHLHQAFLNACEYRNSFAASQLGEFHPILIVGWKLSAFGEMWLTQALHGSEQMIPIAFGQFSVDEECMAPVDNFENTPWQDDAKAFDIDFATDDWYSWTGMLSEINDSELRALAKVLGSGFVSAVNNRTKFLVRDKKKIGRSRWAYLTEISWLEKKNKWKIEVTFLS